MCRLNTLQDEDAKADKNLNSRQAWKLINSYVVEKQPTALVGCWLFFSKYGKKYILPLHFLRIILPPFFDRSIKLEFDIQNGIKYLDNKVS